MKKIGNIFCAVGFIFYGIFLILKKTNYDLGMYVFKFWPLLIVILGIELLVHIKKQDKVKISYLIIVIFVLFISTNGYYSSVNKMQNHGKK